MRKNTQVLVLSWHQTYLSNHAGGYVRLSEFLKAFPKYASYVLLDNQPSIYKGVSQKRLIEYQNPGWIKFLYRPVFLLWFLLEAAFTALNLTANGHRLIKERNIKVIYVPIGEFRHLLIPGLLLKTLHPKVKLVVDLLNYEMPEKSYRLFYQKLRERGTSSVRALAILFDYFSSKSIIDSLLHKADYVFTVSADLRRTLAKVYKKRSIDYTPSGVKMVKLPSTRDKEFLGVYVGRIHMQKGVFDLLSVWQKVVGQKPKAKLAIIGHVDESTLKTLQEKIVYLKLENNVCVYPSVSEKQKEKLLSQSELFLHLAKYEPLFPVIGILEGLMEGLPVVVYDMPTVASQRAEIARLSFIKVVPNSNIEAAAKYILQYIKLPKSKKSQLSQGAHQYAKKFSWPIIADKELKVIKRLATN